MAGLSLASLSIPQSIGYANLAKLDPQYGLSAFGLLRLGFLVDLLSHAAIVGFMGGAAIVIGLQQLKGLLGIAHFTLKIDIISVLQSVWKSHHTWNAHNFVLGCSFLIFLLIARLVGKKKKKLFWIPAIALLLSVILSTLFVFRSRFFSGVRYIFQVTSSIYNLILGKIYCDHYGTMHIKGNREYSCKLKFKEQSMIDRNPHQLTKEKEMLKESKSKSDELIKVDASMTNRLKLKSDSWRGLTRDEDYIELINQQ